MLRRLGIRSKVLAVLAVPMLVVLLAGVFISFEAIRDLRDSRTARQVVDLVATYVPLNDALNAERVASLTAAPPEELAADRQQTDAAITAFRTDAETIDLGRYSGTLAPRLDEVLRQLSEDLPQIRANVDNAQLRVVGTAYTSFVATQLELIDTAAHELTDRHVATYVAAYATVARTADALAQEYVAGREMLTRTENSPAAGQAFATLASQTELLRATARTAVDGLGVAGVGLPTRDPSAAFTQVRNVLATGNVVQMSAVSPTSYGAAFTTQNESFRQVSDGALAEAATVAGRSITSALQRTVLTIGLVALAAAASLVLALVVSRAIVIPLRRLTAAATDVREELPRLVEQVQVPGEGPQLALPQIPVTTRDEVGRLAAAFNAVNSTTVQVAQEQAALRGSIAEMFVNVARRDQVLLNRQLSFIDSLERTEEDPQALANLFRLDHLATRMRRNAESLLVLAGIDSGRRLRDALPLSDVVRTASSEIEQYDRVQLDLQADPHMLGFNALPAAHLLAELLENATVFSEPETPVVVTTAVAGPYVEVRIVDEGLGMTDTELAAANDKISSTSAGDALGAQRLGLFVVGRLAQRLSAEVVLRKSRLGGTGTETVVRFPATLFQSTETSPLGSYSEGAAAAGEAPVVDEVDLASLTDGATPQGLPRRRTADASSGPLPLPTRLPSQPRGSREESIVLPPVAAPEAIPADLSAGSPDWAPVVQSTNGGDLPSRAPAAEASAAPTAEPTPVADPAARAGLFAGFFRGRSEAAAASAGSATSKEAGSASHAAASTAGELPFVVPGLMPEDEPGTEQWTAPEPFETQVTAPAAWALDDVVPEWPAREVSAVPALALDAVRDDVAAAEPVEAEPAELAGLAGLAASDAATEVPVDVPVAADVPAEEPVAADVPEATAEPSWAAAIETPAWPVPDQAAWSAPEQSAWSAPDQAAWSAPETPAWATTGRALDESVAAPAASSVPAAPAAPASPAVPAAPAWPSWAALPSWDAPSTGDFVPAAYQPDQLAPVAPSFDAGWGQRVPDEAATAVAQEDARNEAATVVEPWTPPTLQPWPESDGEAGGWAASIDLGAGDETPYAPFERTLDEARAWATGSIPSVADMVDPAPAPDEAQPVDGVVDVAAEFPADEPSPWPSWSDTAAPAVPSLEPELETLPEPERELDAESAPDPLAVAWETAGQAETTVLQPVVDEAAAGEAPADATLAGEALADATLAGEALASEPLTGASLAGEPPAEETQADAATATAAAAPPEPGQPEPVQPGTGQTVPAWGVIGAATGAFSDLVRDEEPEPKRRRGLFGRRGKSPKPSKATAAPAPAETSAPLRTSAWAPSAVPPPMPAPPTIVARPPARPVPVAPVAEVEPEVVDVASAPTPAPLPLPLAPASGGWSPPASWSPPTAATLPDGPAGTTWSPPEWAPRPADAAPVSEPVASVAPASETRIGTLDDEVAAMLALRSDIQEQALSELSQLSAYRPQVVHGSERLTRRVPAAVPEAAPEPSAEPVALERDPEEIRSRLASFQSGTLRGRRDADREPGESR